MLKESEYHDTNDHYLRRKTKGIPIVQNEEELSFKKPKYSKEEDSQFQTQKNKIVFYNMERDKSISSVNIKSTVNYKTNSFIPCLPNIFFTLSS